jgi:benzoyl-CoA reductase subunit B
VTVVQYESRPLECFQRGQELRQEHWRNVMSAREQGKLLIDGYVLFPVALCAGLGDVVPFGTDVYAANVANNTEFSIRALETVEARGFARDTCGYFRNDAGSMFMDQYLFGGPYPRPDIIFTPHDCEARGRWYQVKAEHLGVPIFVVEVPLADPGFRVQARIDYLVAQFQEGIGWMEKVTGRKYDDERLIQATDITLQSQKLWAEICLLNGAIPAPMNVRSKASIMAVPLMRRHEPVALEFLRTLRDEMKYRVDNKIAAVAAERARVMTDQMPPWYAISGVKYTEMFYGAVWVGMWTYARLLGLFQVTADGGLEPGLTPQERGLPLRTREDALKALAELVLFSLVDMYNTQAKIDDLLRFARVWHCDGVILHFNRSCPGEAVGLAEAKLALKEAGLAVGSYESSAQDPREGGLTEMVESFERIMAVMGLEKL